METPFFYTGFSSEEFLSPVMEASFPILSSVLYLKLEKANVMNFNGPSFTKLKIKNEILRPLEDGSFFRGCLVQLLV